MLTENLKQGANYKSTKSNKLINGGIGMGAYYENEIITIKKGEILTKLKLPNGVINNQFNATEPVYYFQYNNKVIGLRTYEASSLLEIK